MWYYDPLRSSTPARESASSAKPSSEVLATSGWTGDAYCTSSGTQQPHPCWWPGWKRRSWIARLSGLTLEPSTGDHHFAVWLASAQDFPAQPSAPPESASATSIRAHGERDSIPIKWKPGALSLTPSESSASAGPDLFSSKTSPASSEAEPLNPWVGSYADWVTRAKQRSLSLRKTLATRIAESGPSSLWWMTPRSVDGEGNGMRAGGRQAEMQLGGQAKNWPTATTRNAQGNDYSYSSGDHDKPVLNLPGAAKSWPTATATSAPNAGKQRGGGRMSERHTIGDLNEAAKAWPTPNASDNRNTSGGNGPDNNPTLRTAAKNWPSARAEDAERTGSHRGAIDSLNAAINSFPLESAWPTPAARDEKGPNGPDHFNSRQRPHLNQLPNAVMQWATPNIPNRGPESRMSKKTRGAGGVDLQTMSMSFPCIRPHGEPIWRRLREPLRKLPRSTEASMFNPIRVEVRRAGLRLLRVVWRAESGGIGKLSRVWTRPECPRLNPVFSFWLMGIPTQQLIYFAYPETVLSKTLPPSPLSNSGANSLEVNDVV